MTIKELVEQVREADDVASRANEAARLATQTLNERKDALLTAMQAEGMDVVKVDGFSAKVELKKRPHVLDWDTFYAFLRRTGDLQLFERRVSSKAFQEILEARNGKELPGVTTYSYPALQTRRG